MDEEKRAIRKGRASVGHPVDVASGSLFDELVDMELPGRVPLTFRRRYSNALIGKDGMFGPGWSSPWEMRLIQDLDGYRMLDEDGETEVIFDDPDDLIATGEVARDLGAFCELRADGGRYVVTRWDPDSAQIVQYIFAEGAPGEWWPLDSLQDIEGQGVDIQRDEDERIVAVLQRREKRGLRLTYNETARVTAVHLTLPPREWEEVGHQLPDEQQLSLRLGYDEQGLLVQVTDALGQSSHYWYDAAGRLERVQGTNGMDTRFVYDAEGRCVESAGENDFGLIRMEYQPVARVTLATDSMGPVTTYQYNENGQVTSEISPQGNVRATEFDEYGRIVKEITPGGALTAYEFDDRGDRVKVTAPSGGETVYVYNSHHQVTSIVDMAGNSWTLDRDKMGRVARVNNPLGESLSYGYDLQGDMLWMADTAGNRRTFQWNPVGDLASLTDWRGNATTFEYDALGRLTAMVDAHGHRTEGKLDVLGRVRQVLLPDGARRRFSWNGSDQPVEYTDELGGVTRWKYESCGMLAEVTRPHGARVKFQWCHLPGQLLEVTNERGERHRFEYDADGNMISETDLAGGRTVYEHDADGRVRAMEDAAGHRTEVTRDVEGAVTQVVHGDGSETNYSYSVLGLVTAADNGQCVVERAYDAVGRIVCEKRGDHEVRSEYDVRGNRERRVSSLGHETQYSWDANGQLTRLRSAGLSPILFEYDQRQDEIARYVPGGVRVDTQLDTRGHRVEQQVGLALPGGAGRASAGQEPLVHRRYRYDAARNLTEVADRRWGTLEHTYDAVGRICRTRLPGDLGERFEYDDADNVTAIGRPKGDHPVALLEASLEQCEYAKGNVLVRRDKTKYSYNELGQLVRKETAQGDLTRFDWNGAGQLSSVQLPDGTCWEYGYDAFGRRVSKRGPGQTVEFIWDGDVVLHQILKKFDAEGEQQDAPEVVTWQFEPGRFDPIARVDSSGQYLCINDLAGNPREMLSEDGVEVWSARFSTWGELLERGAVAVDCPVRFNGQWCDEESGLHYNRFRYYDPGLGRFVSPDPLGLESSLNSYTYGPNPSGWIDPLGLISLARVGGYDIQAFPGPPAGGIEHKPLHVHVMQGSGKSKTTVTKVLMEDWVDSGRTKGKRGEVYPGDAKVPKVVKQHIKSNLDTLAEKTKDVYEKGTC